MRVVLQRVKEARVSVDGEVTGAIGPGVLLLLGVAPGDTEADVAWLAAKIATLRIFSDEAGRMNLSLLDTAGGALVVSQFTLFGDCRKGRRPSFVRAAPPEIAEALYLCFLEELRGQGVQQVEAGIFGAMMDVSLINSGPVTLLLDSPSRSEG